MITRSPQDDMLDLSHVYVSYGRKTVLEDINVRISRGAFVGLIGPNGAGKTTVLRLVLGLTHPTAGEVRLSGVPVRRGNSSVGYVPQTFHVDAEIPLRARDLVALGLDGHRWGLPLPARSRRHRVDEMLSRVGALEYAEERVGSLSGGERQRLLIAQALLANPTVLLLDEPLSNLDLRSSHEIVELVHEMAVERQITVLFVAHDINPLLGAMDKVLYIARGRAAMGTVEEVVQPETLSTLYGQHVDVLRVHDRIIVVAGDTGLTNSGHHPSPITTHPD